MKAQPFEIPMEEVKRYIGAMLLRELTLLAEMEKLQAEVARLKESLEFWQGERQPEEDILAELEYLRTEAEDSDPPREID